MRLEQLQQALDEALQGRSEPALQHLVSSRRLSSTECLELYRQLLLSAHLRTLQRLFPACARLLGRAHFQQLARHCAHCSTGPPGECMPSRLAQYLDGQPELAGMPFLPELAQLEWLLHCAWRAPDDPELNLDILTEFPEELHSEVRPIASHALRLMNSSWPVYEIWLACRQETPWQPLLELPGGWLCIYRHLDRAQVEKVDDIQVLMLSGILLGYNLYQLSCDVPNLNELLTWMIARGWISRLEFSCVAGDTEPRSE